MLYFLEEQWESDDRASSSHMEPSSDQHAREVNGMDLAVLSTCNGAFLQQIAHLLSKRVEEILASFTSPEAPRRPLGPMKPKQTCVRVTF